MTKIIKAQVEEMCNLYLLDGKRISELSKIININRATITYYLKKNKVFFKDKLNREDIKEEYELNNTEYIQIIRKSKLYSNKDKMKLIINYKRSISGNLVNEK